jgi:zinc transport system substrate-binding protein
LRVLPLLLVLLAPAAAAETRILASIEPLAMVAREVAGAGTAVETLMRPGQSLHGASLTPDQVRAVRDAELFVWLGARAEPGLAPLVRRRAGPDLALLRLDGVHRLHAGAEHAHGEGAREHDEGQATALDPHLWLDPRNMARLGRALAARLGRNDRAFQAALDTTSAAVRARLEPVRERRYVSQHNPWRYFARVFGLQPGMAASKGVSAGASARRFVELGRAMERQQVRCVVAEPNARRALLERLCRGQCRLVDLDPLGRGRTRADYTDFLSHLGRGFRTCLGG